MERVTRIVEIRRETDKKCVYPRVQQTPMQVRTLLDYVLILEKQEKIATGFLIVKLSNVGF